MRSRVCPSLTAITLDHESKACATLMKQYVRRLINNYMQKWNFANQISELPTKTTCRGSDVGGCYNQFDCLPTVDVVSDCIMSFVGDSTCVSSPNPCDGEGCMGLDWSHMSNLLYDKWHNAIRNNYSWRCFWTFCFFLTIKKHTLSNFVIVITYNLWSHYILEHNSFSDWAWKIQVFWCLGHAQGCWLAFYRQSCSQAR